MESDDEIKVGDAVRLKTGGLSMTVVKVNEGDIVVAYSSTGGGFLGVGSTVTREMFPAICLVKVT